MISQSLLISFFVIITIYFFALLNNQPKIKASVNSRTASVSIQYLEKKKKNKLSSSNGEDYCRFVLVFVVVVVVRGFVRGKSKRRKVIKKRRKVKKKKS